MPVSWEDLIELLKDALRAISGGQPPHLAQKLIMTLDAEGVDTKALIAEAPQYRDRPPADEETP